MNPLPSFSEQPLVSILTPTYNRASMLAEAIDSVLKQSYPHWEMIVWDDGSSDETLNLGKRYADPRIRWFRENNRGKCYALNQSLKIARGELIAFLDDDDLWEREKLALQVRVMVAHKQIDLLFTDFENYNQATGVRSISFEGQKSVMEHFETHDLGNDAHEIVGGLFHGLIPLNIVLPSTAVVRRRTCQSTGPFNTSLKSSEDMEYWFRLALEDARFAYIKKNLAKRRKAVGSLSYRGELTLLENITALKSCLQHARTRENEQVSKTVEQALGVAWERTLRFYWESGQAAKALNAFINRCVYGVTFRSIRLALGSLIRPQRRENWSATAAHRNLHSSGIVGSN